jgi:2-octaprenyl-6-methoxyphenol hydroxylase
MDEKTPLLKTPYFDVVISGGGLSGSLMALSLANLKKADGSSLSIAIVEAIKPTVSENTKPLFDDRVLALSHGSASYLKKMDVWQHLSNDACAIEKIDITDRGHYGKARLEAHEHGVSALGYVIEMALIGKAQLKVLASKNNVSWFSPDCITDIEWQVNDQNLDQNNDQCIEQSLEQSNDQSFAQKKKHNAKIEIKLDSGQNLQTSLLLACDGANSPCRQLAGINVSHNDYQQVALIANVATKIPHKNKAFERFTEFGPLAMLPLTEQGGESRCSLVWTMTPEQSQEILALNDDGFKQKLELAFGSWLGAITQVGKRDVYPLVLLQASQQTYHRMALIGNASHTIHPIAGQGFNLGLRDVQQMSTLIENVLNESTDADIGSFNLLNKYAQMRQQDQKQVIELTDSLVTLFANDHLPLVVGRNVGLKVMNYFPPLKSTLVNKLMGY